MAAVIGGSGGASDVIPALAAHGHVAGVALPGVGERALQCASSSGDVDLNRSFPTPSWEQEAANDPPPPSTDVP